MRGQSRHLVRRRSITASSRGDAQRQADSERYLRSRLAEEWIASEHGWLSSSYRSVAATVIEAELTVTTAEGEGRLRLYCGIAKNGRGPFFWSASGRNGEGNAFAYTGPSLDLALQEIRAKIPADAIAVANRFTRAQFDSRFHSLPSPPRAYLKVEQIAVEADE